MKVNNKEVSVKSIITTTLITLIASPIFIQSFGRSLLVKNKISSNPAVADDNFENESKLIYFGSSVLGQISYSLFSSIDGGFFIFPTFENNEISARIHETCMKNDQNGFINTLFCLFLSSLITGLIGFALSFTKLCRMLAYMPLSIVVVTMIVSGVKLLLFGCSLFITPDHLQSGILISVSISITLVLMLLLKKYRNPLIMLYYVLFIIIVMNLARLILPSETIYQWKLFARPRHLKDQFSIKKFGEMIHPEAFDFFIIARVWASIISMSLFPLIPFAVNLPIYTYALGIPFDTFKELRAFGISNIFSSLSFYPVYFNCSGSMLFHLCGSNTRFHSLIAGFTMISFYFFFHHAVRALPTFSVSLLLQFIGLSFLLKYAPMLIQMTFFMDMLCMIVMVVATIYFALGTVELLAMCLFSACLLRAIHLRSIKYGSGAITVIEDSDRTILKVKGYLEFHNVNELLNHVKANPGKKYIVDLDACQYIDMTANFKLRETAIASVGSGYSFHIVGRPNNLYVHLYRGTDFILPEESKAAHSPSQTQEPVL